MCGIIGYTGRRNAADILLEGLAALEYRGYDSAGITLLNGRAMQTIKAGGRLQNLENLYKATGEPVAGCGIGHTRWATHGQATDVNAHPHATTKLALVHNGIIENDEKIKNKLLKKGVQFVSQTDSEVVARLIDYHYDGDPFGAITAAVQQLEGHFALGIVFADHPDTLYALRRGSPLAIGLGKGENFIASDISAFARHTRSYCLLEEMEVAVVTPGRVDIRTLAGNPVAVKVLTADWNLTQPDKGVFPHFMLKEIFEQPQALRNTLLPRIRNDLPDFEADGLQEDFFTRYNKVFFVACGTALHTGMIGKYLCEKLARLPAEAECASEFRYREPVLGEKDLVVLISQSGETADTLAALRLAKRWRVDTLAVVNAAGSSMAREADHTLYTHAGPEISVASTKAFAVQLGLLYLMVLGFAKGKQQLSEEETTRRTRQLLHTVEKTRQVLDYDEVFRRLAPCFAGADSLFYVGRGMNQALAMEGSLKLKEISYIHSEAYAAGELKHGTISLIDEGFPVVGLVTQDGLQAKTIANLKEVKARGGSILVIAEEGTEIDPDLCDHIVCLPGGQDIFMPLLLVIALQLFAYHIAVARGCDVDKPRNLAKSVTVE